MKIDPESRALNGMSTFLGFVALNVLYMVMCVPIITIGAATSALYEVTIRYSDDESGRPIKDFFPAFKNNFVRATIVGACLLVPMAILVFSGAFWAFQGSPLGAAAATIAFIVAVYLFAAFLYGMALVAHFDNSLRQTLKNASRLPAAEPVRTLGILLFPVTAICLTILFPPFAIVVLTIGFSVGAYATAFLFRSVFARHKE